MTAINLDIVHPDDQWDHDPSTDTGSDDAPLTPLEKLRSHLIHGDAIKNIPPPQPLIDGVLDQDSIAALYGRSGGGKSFLALDWALCVSTGTWWQSRHAVTQGPVLYVVAEGVAGMAQRVTAWQHRQNIHHIGDIHWLTVAANLHHPDWAGALQIVATDIEPRLVVIDTLARSMVGAEENSTKDMGIVVAAADQIRRATHACVLLVHHTGKDADKGLRGSSSLEGAVDTAHELRTLDDDILQLTATKQKNHDGGTVWRLRLLEVGDSCVIVDPTTGGYHCSALPDSALAVLQAIADIDTGGGVSSSAILKVVTAAPATVYRRVADLARLGLTTNVGTDKMPRWTVTESGREALDDPTSTIAPHPDEEDF